MTTIKRCVIVALSFILQISFSVVIMLYFYEKLFLVKALVSVLSILIILNIIKNSKRITNEIPIILLIAITPVAGTLIYIALGSNMLKSKTLISIYKSEKGAISLFTMVAMLFFVITIIYKMYILHKKISFLFFLTINKVC